METQSSSRAKDFIINLGAIVALYTSLISLVDLLFTIINKIYPQINYGYFSSESISWPVATLIIFFPIFILLMWLLERDYMVNPAKQSSGIHRWLTYITLFLSGLAIAIDLIMVLYYFINGEELTAGFLLKVLVLLVVASLVFLYYISDVMGKLTSSSRMKWRAVAGILVLASIVWGFSVLGSPRTQRLLKYDTQKVNDLSMINEQVQSFYSTKGYLPKSLEEMTGINYFTAPNDMQTNTPYEYKKTGETTYSLCAEFNKANKEASKPNIYLRPVGYPSWDHEAGHFCFDQTINPNLYSKPVPVR
jgi:hypothetical protein